MVKVSLIVTLLSQIMMAASWRCSETVGKLCKTWWRNMKASMNHHPSFIMPRPQLVLKLYRLHQPRPLQDYQKLEFFRGTEKQKKTAPKPAGFAVIASSMGYYWRDCHVATFTMSTALFLGSAKTAHVLNVVTKLKPITLISRPAGSREWRTGQLWRALARERILASFLLKTLNT